MTINLTYGVALAIKKTLDNILSSSISSEVVIREEQKTENIGKQ